MTGPEVLFIAAHARLPGTVAALRIDATIAFLRSRGWEVTAVARSDARDRSHDLRVEDPIWNWRTGGGSAWRRRTIVDRVVSALLFRLFPDEQVIWSWRLLRQLRNRKPPAVIIVSGPPFSPAVAAALLIRRWPNTSLVLDYRDLWTLGGYFSSRGLRALADRWLERRIWRATRACYTVSEPLERQLQRHASHLQTCVIKNGYDPTAYSGFDVSGEHRHAGLPLRIVHLGELYPGRRNPIELLKAVAGSQLLRKSVHITFQGGNSFLLASDIESLGLQDVVTLAPRVPFAESLRAQEQADVLLLLLWNDAREVGVYSGKLFEYLASRRRILMLGYEHGVAANLIRERHAGVVANDASRLETVLTEWVAEKKSGSLPLNPGSVSTGLDRPTQLGRLDLFLRSLVDES